MASRIKNVVMVIGLLLPALARAEAVVGQVVLVTGAATIRHASGGATAAVFGSEVHHMDALETKKGTLKVLFNDRTLLALGESTKVLVTEHLYNAKKGERVSIYDVVYGTARAVVDTAGNLKRNDVQLQTPTAVAGIRGTDVGLRAAGKLTRVACFNGVVDAFAKSHPQNRVTVKTGEWTDITGPTPTNPMPITPAVRQQFSDVLAPGNLKDTLGQAGAAALSAPPTAGTTETPTQPTSTPPPEQPPAPAQQPQQEQPPTPQYLPGGTTNTPSDAAGNQPVSVPLTFPSQ